MKKIIFLITAFIILLSFTSCAKGYKYWVDKYGYEYIAMDDIIYTTDVEKGWYPWNISEEKIGYIIEDGVPDRNILVCKYVGDEQNLMLMKRVLGIGTVETTFYRED